MGAVAPRFQTAQSKTITNQSQMCSCAVTQTFIGEYSVVISWTVGIFTYLHISVVSLPTYPHIHTSRAATNDF